ncbi:MAG: MFS transporter [Eggerthellaceae bacterium]|nr:MFS transporter [Eggerthellaceae bacterium]
MPKKTEQIAQPKARDYRAILAVYLTGLIIGGLYVGLVAPVRTVIQAHFGIDDATGIWMINIYTLFYAALIPPLGRVADLRGRRTVFMACLVAFAAGSALCGTSAWAGGFGMLLAGRLLQAVGACGMIPIAVAEAGTGFPPEKRGMALGITSAASGLANVLGSAVGSAMLGLIGNANWPWLFFVSVPLCLVLAVVARAVLPNTTSEARRGLDIPGSIVFVLAVLALLFAIRGLDYRALGASLAAPEVWAPLLLCVIGFAAFAVIERRAPSPMFHAEYLKNHAIAVTLLVSFFVGCVLIAMTLIPQYAEFVLGAEVGTGGYYMAILGVFSIVGPVIGGRLIDRVGPKPIMFWALVAVVGGYLFLAFVVTESASAVLLLAGLSLVGLGMGFGMGAPTNYMILSNTSPEDSNSAIATVTLARQLGTSIAPAVFVGFIGSGDAQGYTSMMMAVALCAALALVVLLAYPAKKR